MAARLLRLAVCLAALFLCIGLSTSKKGKDMRVPLLFEKFGYR
jgi:hypothetical protein